MGNKCVTCHKKITWKFSLCRKCAKIYGKNKRDWPEWLREMAADIRREKDRARRDATREVGLEEIDDWDVEYWDKDRFM